MSHEVDKQAFRSAFVRIKSAFPSLQEPSKETVATWFEAVSDIPRESLDNAVRLIVREVEQLYPGTNLAALILRYARPKVTEATVEDQLNHAVTLARSPRPDENPYEYLKKVSPELLELADQAGLFSRSSESEEGFRWKVKDVAKRYQERQENRKRGFEPPQRSTALMIAEKSGGPSEEQLQLTRDNLKRLSERFGGKNDTPRAI